MGGDGGQGATTINFPFDSVTVSKLDVSLATDASTQQAVMEGVQFTHENGQAKLNVATIAQIAEKPALKPVSLTMDIELGAPVTWKGQLQTPDAKLRVPLDGSWDGAKKRLIANALLEPLNFETGMLQPEDVFPLMRGMLLQTQGKIKGKASFACAPECKQSASLTLDAFSTTMGGARMKDASGTIVLKQFYPPLTDGKQTIRIKRLEAGVPLEEGLVQFSLTPDGKVVLEPMKWSWVKGALVTDRIVLTPGSLEGQKVKLHVRHIDLQSLLSLLMKEGMTATGMLDGTIPVQYSKGRLILDNATLGAVGKGTLNYNPASGSPLAGNSQTELLGEALKNFHYELMSLAISSGEDGNAKVAMQLKGANPELYDGKPIELNITLQGHLQDIITQSMDAYSLPEQIGKQYQEKKP